MPTNTSFTSSYAGKAAAKYILPAVTGGETLSTKGISIHTGVKFKEVIKRFSSANIIQSGSTTCNLYNPTGTLTISEAVLEPKRFKINADVCFSDIYKLWDQPSPDGTQNEEISPELEEAIITNFAEKSAEFFDELAWRGGTSGATGNLTLVTGWAEFAKNNGGVGIVATTLTSANVVTEMNKVVNALPSAVKKRKQNLVLFVSYTTAFLYEQNLAAQGLQTTAEGQTLSLYGIEVRPVGGMLDNVMVLGERENFHVATDLESDWNVVNIVDKRLTTCDEVISFIMKYVVDFKIGFPAEVVVYGTNRI